MNPIATQLQTIEDNDRGFCDWMASMLLAADAWLHMLRKLAACTCGSMLLAAGAWLHMLRKHL